MQTAIVVVIVLLAAFLLGWRFYKKVSNSKTDGCAGGCGCCSQNQINTCPSPEADDPKDPI